MNQKQWIRCAEMDWATGVFSVPLKWQGKAPVNKGWQGLRLGPGDWGDFIKPPCNRGRLLGIAPPKDVTGGWVVCVDLDSETARDLGRYFLPLTSEIGQRANRPRAHYFYECNPTPNTARFRDMANKSILDLLSTGTQVLVKPSIHTSGEAYQWEYQGTRSRVDAQDLALNSALLAAACLLITASAAYIADYPWIDAFGSRQTDGIKKLVKALKDAVG